MQAKPWYSSKSILSGLVGVFAWLLNHVFHANIADLVPPLTASLGVYVNNTLELAGIVGAIVGRIKAAHALTLTAAGATAHNLSQAQPAPLQGAAASDSPGTNSLAGEPAGGAASRAATSGPGAVPASSPFFPANNPTPDHYTK